MKTLNLKHLASLILFGLAVFGVTTNMGIQGKQLLHTQALLGVLALTFTLSLFHIGVRDTLEAFAAAFLGYNAPKKKFKSSGQIVFAQQAPVWAMTSASIVSLLELIRMFAQPNNATQVGIATAVIFMSFFYGCVLTMILPAAAGAPGLTLKKSSADRPYLAVAFSAVLVVITIGAVFHGLHLPIK